jgi:hypothetical protein
MITSLEEVAPYGATADDYLVTGIGVPLPIPPGSKRLEETGVTGRYADATAEQIATWIATKSDHNIAVRLARNVIGLDVDHYGNKTGGDTLADLGVKLGSLPETVISSRGMESAGFGCTWCQKDCAGRGRPARTSTSFATVTGTWSHGPRFTLTQVMCTAGETCQQVASCRGWMIYRSSPTSGSRL